MVMSTKLDTQQPTWRFWGEERTDGAIYTVYLKKVRYYNPSKSIHNDSDDKIAHLEWETVRVRMIKAGSLEKLVENLYSDIGDLESSYINVFLATYRTFSNTQEVLNLLLEKCKDFDKEEYKETTAQEHYLKAVRSTLTVWLDAYPDDFRDPPNYRCLNQITEFANSHISDGELQIRIKHKLEKFKREAEAKLSPCNDFLADIKCKSPAIINGNVYNSTCTVLDIPTNTFAEQLTLIDSELFKKVVPHHCLGSEWSRREKSKGNSVVSVVATVDQFNAVSFRVISTVLMDTDLKLSFRAKFIAKWIDIAQKLRLLKNFSSLKAIISGLQSTPVYRLRQTWQAIPRETVELFDELARIFSEDNNQMTCRELLMKEGTAKVAANVGENDRHLQKVLQEQFSNGMKTIQGTIPYLGTFLTDLTMIDTAIPDVINGNLINFDKKRKEFEVLAQIKLLQLAANSYCFQPDHNFQRWFENLPVLDDKESYEISCLIEMPSAGNTPKEKKCGLKSGKKLHCIVSTVLRVHGRRSPIETLKSSVHKFWGDHCQTICGCGQLFCNHTKLGHRKTDSIASTSSSSSSQFYDHVVDSSNHSTNTNMCDHSNVSIERKMSTSSSSSSLPSLDVSLSSANSTILSTHSSTSSPSSPYKTPDFYVIRVSLENEKSSEQDGVILYKSIMLSNSEHTPIVIRNAMLKHSLEGDPDDYCLVQQLPNGEIVFPSNANVYYAINTAYDLNFILRQRRDEDTPGVKKLPKLPKSKKKISHSV
ncbi:hypothetical protein CHUAL_009256 [Chamberlinius hualienensis]